MRRLFVVVGVSVSLASLHAEGRKNERKRNVGFVRTMSFRNYQDMATLHLPFPISRKRLQDICEEYDRNKEKVYISELVDGITCEIVETARKRPPLVLYSSTSLKIMFRDFPLYSKRIHHHFAEKYIPDRKSVV